MLTQIKHILYFNELSFKFTCASQAHRLSGRGQRVRVRGGGANQFCEGNFPEVRPLSLAVWRWFGGDGHAMVGIQIGHHELPVIASGEISSL